MGEPPPRVCGKVESIQGNTSNLAHKISTPALPNGVWRIHRAKDTILYVQYFVHPMQTLQMACPRENRTLAYFITLFSPIFLSFATYIDMIFDKVVTEIQTMQDDL